MAKIDEAFDYASQIGKQLNSLYEKNKAKQVAADAVKKSGVSDIATKGERNFLKNFKVKSNGLGAAGDVGKAIDIAKGVKKKGVMAGYADAMGLQTKDPTKDYE